MENRIDKLFKTKRKDILSVFLTAGYPDLKDTLPLMVYLQDAGVDMIELGFPFSDPLADGPVIQQSSLKALQNGMNLPVLFEQLSDMRKQLHIPVLLMGYLNPVMSFGVNRFLSEAARVGVDGFILPDLPLSEYKSSWSLPLEQYQLKMAFLITPETKTERIEFIDSLRPGFIYVVSASSTTGNKITFSEEQLTYFSRVSKMQLLHPKMIGFGISNKSSLTDAFRFAQGGIIGSAFIHFIAKEGCTKDSVHHFINTFR